MNVYVLMSQNIKQVKKFPSVGRYNRGCLYNVFRCTTTFEGVSASKQTLVDVFYVENVVLVLKSKVRSRS